jgi:5-methylcytosine-specific restriction endonuclease McrA
MTSDDDLKRVLRMLGQAIYSWGIHSLDDDTSDEEILGNLSTESRFIAERFVRRNMLGDSISRYIPQDVKVAVAVRDQGQCTGKLPDGTRCPRKESLHFDHRIIPFRLGGPQTTWNLTLLCEEHNWVKGGSLGGGN